VKEERVAVQLRPVSGRLNEKMFPDDWGQPDSRAPQGSCLAISVHLSDRVAEPYHHIEAARRWCSSRLFGNFVPFLSTTNRQSSDSSPFSQSYL